MLSVSLQGNSYLHDLMRGMGNRERAKKGVHNALEEGIKGIIFSAVGKSLLPQLPLFADSLFNEFQGIERLTLIQLIRVADDIFDQSAMYIVKFESKLVQNAHVLKLVKI